MVPQEGGTVGVDMEWRAGFGCVVPQRVALIQLAVLDQVFILDMCSAGLWQHPSTLDFMKSFLSDAKVRKLGKEAGRGGGSGGREGPQRSAASHSALSAF